MAQLGLRKWGSQYTTIEKEKHKRQQFRVEKLTGLLNQKMHRAFGLTVLNPTIEEEIEKFVVNNQGDFSQLKLKKLQNEIAEKLAPEGITLKKRKARGSVAARAGMEITNSIPNKGLSRGSAASMSVKSITGPAGVAQNARGSQMSQRTLSHKSLAESDQWREIENFNTLLYLEEQNQEIIREKNQQRMIKEELDRQIKEKKELRRQEIETEKMYEDMQRKILDEADRKERYRVEKIKDKIKKDKEGRDRQMIMDKAIRQGEIEREKAQEALMINKLKKELELEKLAFKQQKQNFK